MDLNWSTFFLETINFLVLVWILKRFLYRPVLDIIAKRQASIDKTLSDARTIESTAHELQQRYDNRLATWEAEKRKAREALTVEIENERASRLADLDTALEKQQQKVRVAEAQRLAVLREQQERAALALGAGFAARLLKDVASQELEGRLVDFLLEALAAQSVDRLRALAGLSESAPDAISVSSAFVLPDDTSARLEAALSKLTGLGVPLRFTTDPSLLAGLRVTIGATVLGFNLADELRDFAKLGNGHD